MNIQTDQQEEIDERDRERHFAAHHATFYTSDDKIAAVELLREAGYWFRWNYTNSCGQEIGFWTNDE